LTLHRDRKIRGVSKSVEVAPAGLSLRPFEALLYVRLVMSRTAIERFTMRCRLLSVLQTSNQLDMTVVDDSDTHLDPTLLLLQV
jgi:hypothetical protein